ncbi:MAG TPA: IclR family transcriptional regulator [Thermoleophilia bacterium]|nr:IclR family transcriptional regulator [Thermoleophilia bacterium]
MTTTQRDAANGRAKARLDRDESDPLTVRALARGLSILALYDMDHREWTIDEMAARTGLLRMTAYRMVRTLEAAQFLVRDTVTNRYHLGPAAITMAYVAEDNSEFIEHARPYLVQLLEATGESVTLAVPVDGAAVCVSIIDSARPFQRQIAPGRIIGDLAGVHAKIFTAFAPPERRAAVLAQKRRKHTAYTVTDPEQLKAELEKVVREDVAYDLQGLYTNVCSVGSPVRDQLGHVVAAVSVVMPASRFGPREKDLCTQAVKEAASSLSAYLGWNPTRPSSGAAR